jgi:hypothetical protein
VRPRAPVQWTPGTRTVAQVSGRGTVRKDCAGEGTCVYASCQMALVTPGPRHPEAGQREGQGAGPRVSGFKAETRSFRRIG